MTFDEREKSFETKFVLDEEKEFKAKAMASKLFGQWAAQEMQMADQDKNIYSKALIDLSITSKEFDPIISHVQDDFLKKGIKTNRARLEKVFLKKFEESRERLSNS